MRIPPLPETIPSLKRQRLTNLCIAWKCDHSQPREQLMACHELNALRHWINSVTNRITISVCAGDCHGCKCAFAGHATDCKHVPWMMIMIMIHTMIVLRAACVAMYERWPGGHTYSLVEHLEYVSRGCRIVGCPGHVPWSVTCQVYADLVRLRATWQACEVGVEQAIRCKCVFFPLVHTVSVNPAPGY